MLKKRSNVVEELELFHLIYHPQEYESYEEYTTKGQATLATILADAWSQIERQKTGRKK